MDELTPEQLDVLRAALLALRDGLRETLLLSREAARPVELDQQAIGRVSRIDAIQQQKMVEANRQRARVRMNQADAALRAMDDGEYGCCRKCDEPIEFRRLQARPETTICVECQEEMERAR